MLCVWDGYIVYNNASVPGHSKYTDAATYDSLWLASKRKKKPSELIITFLYAPRLFFTFDNNLF